MCYIFDRCLQKHQRQAVISSQLCSSELAMGQWLRDHEEPGTRRFSPVIVGQQLFELVSRCDPTRIFSCSPQSPDVDWKIGIEITAINFVYGISRYKVSDQDGYIAFLNADFVYTSTEPLEAPTWAR